MNGTEIITLLSNNFDLIKSAVGPVVGAVFTAIFLRSNTSTQEFEKMKAGKFQEVANDLLASGKMTYTEYYKSKNFLKVAKKADEYLSVQEQPKEQQYDFDWFIRFYEAVGNISNEEMQELWAKMLAGEIKSPSKYSLKTIDVLKNISQKEARLFNKICSHSFMFGNNIFLPNYDGYLEKYGINYSDIMLLSEYNLIYNDATIILQIPVDSSEQKALCAIDDLILFISAADNNTTIAKIKQFPFSQVGCELALTIGTFAKRDDYIVFGRELNKDSRINVNANRIIRRNGEVIEYNKQNLLDSDCS